MKISVLIKKPVSKYNSEFHGTPAAVSCGRCFPLPAITSFIRTGKAQMRMGGISDPRNKTLLKMFNLINIGERSGSGVPNIFNTWQDEGWVEPVIEEQFDPDRTILTLEFKKQATENKR